MNETPFNPEHPPDETDRTLDLYLASLARFEPGPGFADRVMARVEVRQPVPVPVRRWPARRARTVGTLAGLASATSTVLTAWVVTNFDALAAATASAVSGWARIAWDASVAVVPSFTAQLGESLADLAWRLGPVTAAGVVAGAVLSIPIGMFGLYLAARPPLRSRMVTHAAP